MIDALIARRADSNGPAERAREELYMQSVSRYHAERRQDHRAAWVEFHAGQAARHRLKRLEERIGPPETRSSSSTREAMRAFLDRVAAARRAGSTEEGEAEVQAMRGAIARRRRELEGEGA
jgi:hypothetical protein